MAINRREAIKKATYFMGGTLSAPAILGVLNGCAPDPKPGWTPTFFDNEQALTIQELAETIYPATDTLGAKDLGVPRFIEEMVSTVYDEEARNKFVQGLAAFMEEVVDKEGKSFRKLEAAQKLAIAKEKNDYINSPEGQASDGPFFWSVKELTLLGFFTSEYGATRVMQYELVPAVWEPCKPLSETGTGVTWATS
ncbi:MAG: gluconate 2-dehydrogenase subunit 3 family protein [Cytophagales bacterium]|nr:gluconate 2-dehydrogenase subunit 3 family protein [Cytophagales bacterium]